MNFIYSFKYKQDDCSLRLTHPMLFLKESMKYMKLWMYSEYIYSIHIFIISSCSCFQDILIYYKQIELPAPSWLASSEI